MQIPEKELKDMIREVVSHVAQELLEQMEDEPGVGDSVEIVGTSTKGRIEEKSENRYWVSFDNKEGGGSFEPRHIRIIEDESQDQQ